MFDLAVPQPMLEPMAEEMKAREHVAVETQSDTEQTKSRSKTRVRLKSPRLQLQVTLQRMEKLAQSNTLKEAKAADLLMSMAELQKMFLQLTLDEKKETLQGEHAALSAQHAADAQHIQALEAQSAALKSHRCEVMTRVEPDPEHKKVRAERDTLSAAFKFLAGVVTNKEQAAIQAIQQLPADAACSVCDAVGIKEREYRQYLQTYRSERDLLNVIENAQVDDTPLLRFVRAALSVNHSLNLDVPRPKNDAARLHSLQEELIERERQENADRQATMNFAWRRQMGL
jgi:hypothetical protein